MILKKQMVIMTYLNKLFDTRGEEEDCSDESGDGELHCQQTIHFPHEP